MVSRWGLCISVALCACGLLLAAGTAAAASLEQIGTYAAPVYVTSDPGDPNRIFVVEQGGDSDPPRIRLTTGGSTATFLDLGTLSSPGVSTAGPEQGLLSMAFAPDFAASGRFYVFYTGDDGGTLHVDEFTAHGDTAGVDTRRTVIEIARPIDDGNHNAGQLQLGPDGNLYISTGDSGCCGDPVDSAQDTGSLLGKILRITPTPGGGYTVPAGNPFVGGPGADPVWSLGLRNPWRFSFDRLTGDLWIADVGDASWEEVNFDPVALGAGRGDNFGWDCREGRHPFTRAPSSVCSSLDPHAFSEPVHEYPNLLTNLVAVVGGYVVRDESLCELYGRYLYGDAISGEVRSLLPGWPDASDDRSEGLTVEATTSFGEDAAGRVYVASHAGPVYRLVHEGAPCPRSEPPDTDPPFLAMSAALKQDIADRRFEIEAEVNEPVVTAFEATIGRRKSGEQVGDALVQSPGLEPNRPADVEFKLSRREARRARRLIHKGIKLKATVIGSATDAAGNTTTHRVPIRLLLD